MVDQKQCSVVQRHALNVELFELCRTHRPLPTYVVDETLKQHGHTAIRMTPYHAELNSIELIWAMLRGKEARSNLTLKKKDVKKADGRCI